MTSAAREALKWFALVLMVGDHVNAGLLGRGVPLLYDFGRLVMPIFAAVLAFNFANRGGDYRRMFERLCVVGLIAYPFHVVVLGQGFYTFNILFGYAIAVLCMWLYDRWGIWGVWASVVVVYLGGIFVEFHWAAPLVTLGWWCWWRYRSGVALSFLLGSFVLLCFFNGNYWAFGALPVVFFLRNVGWDLPRWRWLFWVFYPAHLAVIAFLVWVVG